MKRKVSQLLRMGTALSLAAMCSTASAGDLLSRIKQSGEITIATEARFAPFEYVSEGKIVGYGVDLMNYVLESELPGVKVKQLDMPFQGILPGLDSNRFDFVVTSVTVNQQRYERFAFTSPIAESTVALLKRANDDSIQSINDIKGKTIGSQAGSGQLSTFEAFNNSLEASGAKGIRQYVSFDEAYADLATRRIDGVAQSLSNLGPLMSAKPGMFSTLPEPIGPVTYYGWVGRQDEDSKTLVELFSRGITKANQDGTMQELQQKWFGFTMDIPQGDMPAPQS